MTKLSELKLGDRLELLQGVDRYPDFAIPRGAKGTVTNLDGFDKTRAHGCVWVTMDDHIPGCEEWDNQLALYIGLDDNVGFILLNDVGDVAIIVDPRAPRSPYVQYLPTCGICGGKVNEKRELWVVGYMDPNSSERVPFWSCLMAAPASMQDKDVIAYARQTLAQDDAEIKARNEEWEVGDYDDPALLWFAEHIIRPIIVGNG